MDGLDNAMARYAELQSVSNFSFLRGASHPDELIWIAQFKGLHALALCDHNTFAGVVRAHVAAKEYGVRFIPGVHLTLRDHPPLLCYPSDRNAYGRLCRMLTLGKGRAVKGDCELYLADVVDHSEGSFFIALQPCRPDEGFRTQLITLKEKFTDKIWLSINCLFDGFDHERRDFSEKIEREVGIPVVATNDVHMHTSARKALQDVLVCIREHCRLDEAGYRLFSNGERTLKSADEMSLIFEDHPEWISRSVEIADACHFSLDQLSYEYPDEAAEPGEDSQERLNRLAREGIKKRYPMSIPEKVRIALERELKIITELAFASYFLTVYDIVKFAHEKGILCQGRGSAANSVVCYCLFITEVAPDRIDLLFERFMSAARNEPPDIDVDFEHERREEVIQYIYQRYGRDRAGLTATVITYRSKSALREVGKTFGLNADTLSRLSKTIWGWGTGGIKDHQLQEAGLSLEDDRLRTVLDIARELIGFPRHLSQHVGGFVITRGLLNELSPIANAAMEGRTTIEWNKDDINALGILKVDILALGMLSAIRKSFDLLRDHKGIDFDLATLPKEEPGVYKMLQKADAIGVFQIESRAQLSMLPRLKPEKFYDLVVEVAIVRPGPIQGDMVHPYLRRRMGKEKVEYPSEELKAVLSKTYGVPLFQEQAMQVAIVGAGFSPEEADRLRRDMASFRRLGKVNTHRDKFLKGMQKNGYDAEFSERCFQQIEGFADYGFPESHAASFANLVYVSAWLKHNHPDVFTCALLNSQPMGFYAPAQLVRDARNHHVNVLPVDVNHSYWDNHLEKSPGNQKYLSLRLGFRQIKGVRELDALALITNRPENGFTDLTLVAKEASLPPLALEKLAEADAFLSLGLSRRDALWAIRRLGRGKKKAPPLPLFEASYQNGNWGIPAEFGMEKTVTLPPLTLGEEVIEDYASLRLSLKAHPLYLLRDQLAQAGIRPAIDLINVGNNKKATIAGLIIARQRPGTAHGVVFMTLEDETDTANVIIWPKIFMISRPVIMGSTMVAVRGKIQHEEGVTHLIADELVDLSGLLQSLSRNTFIQSRANRHPRNLSWSTRPASSPTPSQISLDGLAKESQNEESPIKVESRDFH